MIISTASAVRDVLAIKELHSHSSRIKTVKSDARSSISPESRFPAKTSLTPNLESPQADSGAGLEAEDRMIVAAHSEAKAVVDHSEAEAEELLQLKAKEKAVVPAEKAVVHSEAKAEDLLQLKAKEKAEALAEKAVVHSEARAEDLLQLKAKEKTEALAEKAAENIVAAAINSETEALKALKAIETLVQKEDSQNEALNPCF